MSLSVSIYAVAKAAGVSICTVSQIVNGRTNGVRFSKATRQRVLAVAREMNYQPDPVARNIARGLGAPPRPAAAKPSEAQTGNAAPETAKKRLPIVILLSGSTSAATLGLLPGLFPTLAATGFAQLVITLPYDPAIVREEVRQLIAEGVSGFLCCPTLYPTVADQVASRKPTLVIWQGAGTAMAREVGNRTVPPENRPKTIDLRPVEPSPVVIPPLNQERQAPAAPPVKPQNPPPASVIEPAKPVVSTPQNPAPVLKAKPESMEAPTTTVTAEPPPANLTPEITVPPPQEPPPVASTPEPPVFVPTIVEEPPASAPEPEQPIIAEPEILTATPETAAPVTEPDNISAPAVVNLAEPAPPPQVPETLTPASEPSATGGSATRSGSFESSVPTIETTPVFAPEAEVTPPLDLTSPAVVTSEPETSIQEPEESQQPSPQPSPLSATGGSATGRGSVEQQEPIIVSSIVESGSVVEQTPEPVIMEDPVETPEPVSVDATEMEPAPRPEAEPSAESEPMAEPVSEIKPVPAPIATPVLEPPPEIVTPVPAPVVEEPTPVSPMPVVVPEPIPEAPVSDPVEPKASETEAPVFETEKQLVFGFHSFPSTMNAC